MLFSSATNSSLWFCCGFMWLDILQAFRVDDNLLFIPTVEIGEDIFLLCRCCVNSALFCSIVSRTMPPASRSMSSLCRAGNVADNPDRL